MAKPPKFLFKSDFNLSMPGVWAYQVGESNCQHLSTGSQDVVPTTLTYADNNPHNVGPKPSLVTEPEHQAQFSSPSVEKGIALKKRPYKKARRCITTKSQEEIDRIWPAIFWKTVQSATKTIHEDPSGVKRKITIKYTGKKTRKFNKSKETVKIFEDKIWADMGIKALYCNETVGGEEQRNMKRKRKYTNVQNIKIRYVSSDEPSILSKLISISSMDWQQSHPISNIKNNLVECMDWTTSGETVFKVANRPDKIRSLVKLVEDMDWDSPASGAENLQHTKVPNAHNAEN